MKSKTIIILSAKRCGSTALYKTLVNHSKVRNCQVGGKTRNWEPAFWYHGWLSLMKTEPEHVREHFRKNYSYMHIPDVHNKFDLYRIWDEILKHRGPTVVDKSPQYLSSKATLSYLLGYKNIGRDVKIIGLIRDPRDAITSQYVKWHRIQTKKSGIVDTPERREAKWLEKYKNLEYVLSRIPDMLMVKYEDFATDTYHTVRQICRYCRIQYQGGMDAHVVPTNIGRYKESKNRKIRKWENNWTSAFKEHLKHFGYI